MKVIKLEQNYRSTGTILRAANTLIANNPHVYDKTLWSEMGDGAPIRVVVNRHEEAEAERVASEMLTRRIKEKAEWRDFAVLYRGNFQARLLELKLQHYQIPYKLSGGTSFFSRNEIKDAMAYLRLLINPADDNAFCASSTCPGVKLAPVRWKSSPTTPPSAPFRCFPPATSWAWNKRCPPAPWSGCRALRTSSMACANGWTRAMPLPRYATC
ncbi:hypothetical protein HAALTHF_10010n [Vreelandella aquamarina]|nr:hypothetical protein HAALTHF_10010n [Halomonas axialensis]